MAATGAEFLTSGLVVAMRIIGKAPPQAVCIQASSPAGHAPGWTVGQGIVAVGRATEPFGPTTRKARIPEDAGLARKNPGGVLFSHTVAHAVPSALEGLTAEFGMGSGVPPPPLPPGKAYARSLAREYEPRYRENARSEQAPKNHGTIAER